MFLMGLLIPFSGVMALFTGVGIIPGILLILLGGRLMEMAEDDY